LLKRSGEKKKNLGAKTESSFLIVSPVLFLHKLVL